MRILNDVNYAIQKIPNGRIQICHVDHLLKYEGETPAIWVKYDRESGVHRTDEVKTFSQANEQLSTVTGGSDVDTKKTNCFREDIRRSPSESKLRTRTLTEKHRGESTIDKRYR